MEALSIIDIVSVHRSSSDRFIFRSICLYKISSVDILYDTVDYCLLVPTLLIALQRLQ